MRCVWLYNVRGVVIYGEKLLKLCTGSEECSDDGGAYHVGSLAL